MINNQTSKNLGEKKRRQQKGINTEKGFEKFCDQNKIIYSKIDNNRGKSKDVLKNPGPGGKCPDYLCLKDGIQIFIEVKTHTLLTNEARNKYMKRVICDKKAAGLSGTTMFEPFDPHLELKGVFEGYLRGASQKFKNIKEEVNFPRILLLNGQFVYKHDIIALFLGAYYSFKRGGEYDGLLKKHRGLFDQTGSNVSAIVYWSFGNKRYEGIENPKAKIKLSEDDFKKFFIEA